MSDFKREVDCVPRKRKRIGLEVQSLLNDIFLDEKERQSLLSEPIQYEAEEGVAGKIISVRLQNFMCHSNLEFNFGDKINFISGKNGSGKSAILTALVIGLGGRTADTNRGQSIKSLIQNGKNRATIEITMNNRGQSRFKGHLYGNVIKVIRIISGSSSQYKLFSERGELVSTKREDLELINLYFNIQVNNPVTILNQDTARTFIKTALPKDLYRIFMKGTYLEEIEERLLALRNEKIPTLEKLIDEKKCVLQEAYKDVKTYKEKLKKIKELEEYQDKAIVLQNELFWAYVYKTEEKYNSQKAILEECEKKLPQLREKVDKRDKVEKELKDKLSTLGNNLKELKSGAREVDSEILELEQSLRNTKEQVSGKLNEMKRVEKKIVGEKNSCEQLQVEIDNNASQLAKIELQKERLNNQKNDLETRLGELKAVMSTTLVHRQQLTDTMNAAAANVTQKEQFYRNLQQKLSYKEDYLRGLKIEKNQLMVYSKWMPELVSVIDRAHTAGKFIQKPRGPLGSFIKLKEKSWGPAIENFIGAKTLSSFCVDNTQDYKMLKSIIDRMNMPAKMKPPISISKFLNKVHDVNRNETRSGNCVNLWRSITVSDPVVANALIDAIEPEAVLLIPTSDEAYRLLEDVNNVPAKCRKAFTKTGDLFYPAPNYRSYAGTAEGTRYLQVSQATAVKYTEQEIQTIKEELIVLEDDLSKAKINLATSNEKLEEVKREVHTLNKQIASCENKLDEIRREVLPETYDVSLLKEDLEYRRKTLNTCEETLKRLENEKNELFAKYQDTKDKFENIQTVKNEKSQEISKVEAEIEEVNNDCYKISGNRSHYIMLLKNEESKLQSVTKVVDDLKIEFEKAEKDAKEAHEERIPQKRSIEILEKDLSKINNMMKVLEKIVGNIDDVPAEYYQRVKQLQEKHNTLEQLTRAANKLKSIVGLLEDSGKKVKELVSLSTKHSFLSMLNKKNFKGDLIIDHEKKLLKVVIKVESAAKEGSATLTLSGGERSYSMVSFIMALWSNMNSPFFFLDEFDVFMDEINRNMVMSMLLSYAKSKPDQQFVFLTPHGQLPNELLSEVHFFRMNDPRSREMNGES